eukprot:158803-Amphidinium_carterae.1
MIPHGGRELLLLALAVAGQMLYQRFLAARVSAFKNLKHHLKRKGTARAHQCFSLPEICREPGVCKKHGTVRVLYAVVVSTSDEGNLPQASGGREARDAAAQQFYRLEVRMQSAKPTPTPTGARTFMMSVPGH